MKAMSQEERTVVFQSMVALVKQNVAALEVFCNMLKIQPDEKEPLTEEEQRVVELFSPGTVLTGKQVAKLIGEDPESGSFKKKMSSIVHKGHLVNKRPGYALPED